LVLYSSSLKALFILAGQKKHFLSWLGKKSTFYLGAVKYVSLKKAGGGPLG
jgi:hypothetical protein